MTRLAEFSQAWAAWAWAASWQFALFVALVAASCWGLRAASPRLRHALWVLAFLKVLLPTTFSLPWSVGNWLDVPNVAGSSTDDVYAPKEVVQTSDVDLSGTSASATTRSSDELPPRRDSKHAVPWWSWAMLLWASGGLTFWGIVAWRYRRMSRTIAAMPAIEEGPLRIELERAAQRLHVSRVPDLHITDSFTSPFLFGLVHPRVVLPRIIADGFSRDELRAVLLHELTHWRRRDTWIGAAQVGIQGLLWFHPLVWWAAVQLRNERENVCDDAVVRLGTVPPQQYGEVIVRVLTAARGRSDAAGSLVGVFERGSRLQQRLEDVMAYETDRRTFGWASRAALCGFALLFLPMAGRTADPETTSQKSSAANPATVAETDDAATDAGDSESASRHPDPQIVETVPAIGETGVDPKLSELRVTFDRDMGKGMSWTGDQRQPEFPPIDRSRKAEWIDERTCVLPVSLKRGAYYRIGINSTSHQNFKSADGVPAAPSVIYFATAGANRSVERRVRVPQVVELDPPNNAAEVDPATSALRVTFDMPMGEAFSWTGGGDKFPTIPNGQRPRWSKDGRTCTLPVRLEPGHEYHLGLNSTHHINFQSKWGVPLKPVEYTFTTRSE